MSNVVEFPGNSKYLEMIVFEVNNLRCGILIQEIQEIIEPPNITKVPMPHDEIEGLINLRGQIVTIINMRVRCGFDRVPVQKSMRVIATKIQGELMGLLVERIEDSIQASPENIIPVPGNINDVTAEVYRSVYKKDDQLIGILDLENTLLGVAS